MNDEFVTRKRKAIVKTIIFSCLLAMVWFTLVSIAFGVADVAETTEVVKMVLFISGGALFLYVLGLAEIWWFWLFKNSYSLSDSQVTKQKDMPGSRGLGLVLAVLWVVGMILGALFS